jgi:energy-coupling factor transporter ATP-binding protein EcfA2
MGNLAQVKQQLPDSSAYKNDRYFKTLLPFTGQSRFSKSLTFDINMVALVGILEGAGKPTSVQALQQLVKERAPPRVSLESGYDEEFSTSWLLRETKKISKMNSIFQQQALEALPEFVAKYRQAYPNGGAHVDCSFADLLLEYARVKERITHFITAKRLDCCERHKAVLQNLPEKKQQKVVAGMCKAFEKEMAQLEKKHGVVFNLLHFERDNVTEELNAMKLACAPAGASGQ